MRSAAPSPFDIATQLLGGAGLWSNLGDWSAAASYDEACHALALRIGTAAGISSGARVLDIACGYGASCELWLQECGATAVTAVDLRQSCVDALRARNIKGVDQSICSSADTLDRALHQRQFDAIVCVDAAYHFADAGILARLAAKHLAVNGRLAYTTIVRRKELSLAQRLAAAAVMKMARIPAAAIVTQAQLNVILAEAGLTAVTIKDITEQVATGFSNFVERRTFQVSASERRTAAWWKIAGTAKLCGRMARSPWAYVMVAAEVGRHFDGVSASRLQL